MNADELSAALVAIINPARVSGAHVRSCGPQHDETYDRFVEIDIALRDGRVLRLEATHDAIPEEPAIAARWIG